MNKYMQSEQIHYNLQVNVPDDFLTHYAALP